MGEIRLKDSGEIKGLKWPADVTLIVEGKGTIEDCEYEYYK